MYGFRENPFDPFFVMIDNLLCGQFLKQALNLPEFSMSNVKCLSVI